jgi:uncharacterized protein (TIRG00374 family)
VNKRILWTAFQYFLAFALLTWVIWKAWGTPGSNGLGDVWERHFMPPPDVKRAPVHWEYLFMGFAVYAAAVFLTLIRWYLLVRAQGLQVSLGEALRLGLVGCFYSLFLPGSVGGDLVKATVLARGQQRRTVAAATVIMDRIIALWGLIWLVAALGSVFWLSGSLDGKAKGPATGIVTVALAVVGVSLAAWVVMGFLSDERAERFAGRLRKLRVVGGPAAEMWRAAWLYRSRQRSVWVAMFLSWASHVGFIVSYYCSALVLTSGDTARSVPSFTQHFVIVPIGMVVSAIPGFPGGAGITEAGFGGLYELFSYPMENGTLMALVNRMFIMIPFALIGFLISRWQVRGTVETAAEGRGAPSAEETTNGEAVAPATDAITKGPLYFNSSSAIRNPQ